MMALDGYNVLNTWPLAGWEHFVERCAARGVRSIYLTGTNTDPLLYKHIRKLSGAVRLLNLPLGIRSNGVANLDQLRLFDTGSVSLVSFNPAIYSAMMGQG